MMQFAIARHGNTFLSDEEPRRIGARTDLPLTDQGKEQARTLGRRLSSIASFDRVLCGPLRRTRQTAEIATAEWRQGVAVEIADWLNEIDYGPDEGQRECDVLDRVGADALAAWNDAALPAPGWRHSADVTTAAWRQFLSELCGPTVLFTSSGAARMIFHALNDLPRPATMALGTACYSLFSTSQGVVDAYEWNWRPSDERPAFQWNRE